MFLPRILSLAALFALQALPSANAGAVQLLDGNFHEGTVSLDRGVLIRNAASQKVALGQILFARFTDEAPPMQVSPGLVLTNGTRIAGGFSSLFENPVLVAGKNLRIPSADVAMAVFQPFPAAQARELPPGKTGALLPGSDFFEGAVKSADSRSARVVNPIFGPKVFTAASKQANAVVVRGFAPQPAAFEVLTRDGSRYLALDVVSEDVVSIVVRHPHYDGLRIATGDVLEIRAAPARVLDLSDWKPSETTGPVTAENADGSRLRFGTQVVPGRSISAGAAAKWKKAIRGGVFYGRIGPGPETSAGTNLVFVAEADGRILFRSPAIPGGSAPQVARFAVPPAESFVLRVEGETGRGVWADPTIVLR